MNMKFLSIFLLFGCLLIWGCNRSAAPQERPQTEIDQIIKRVADLNAKIEVFRARILEHDRKLKAYRQEIQELRSQTGEGRKDRKTQIRSLKFLANQAKKARQSERIRIQVYTQKVQELVADFDTFFREASE